MILRNTINQKLLPNTLSQGFYKCINMLVAYYAGNSNKNNNIAELLPLVTKDTFLPVRPVSIGLLKYKQNVGVYIWKFYSGWKLRLFIWSPCCQHHEHSCCSSIQLQHTKYQCASSSVQLRRSWFNTRSVGNFVVKYTFLSIKILPEYKRNYVL